MVMKKFYEKVDMRSRKKMIEFLTNHFRYPTANSWNYSTSYAHNMKIYNLGLSKEIEDNLWNMLDCEDVYDTINELVNDFAINHDFIWQAGFNGRSGGYLVLYSGGKKPSEYKSFCRHCGQKNYTSIKETGNVCGRCGKPERIDFVNPPMNVFAYPGKAIDMDEDFESWSMDELKERVKLIQEFDKLADDIVSEAIYMAENFKIEEETVYIPQTRKVIVQ